MTDIVTEETTPLYLNIKTDVDGTDASGKLRNKFDFTICVDEKMLKDEIPVMYKFLYEYYKVLCLTVKNRPLVTMSYDRSISTATIAGVSEKYLKLTSEDDKPKYISTMKILYIDSRPDLENISLTTLSDSVVSNLMCIDNVTYTKHKTVINPDQIIYLGLNEDYFTDFDIDKLAEYGVKYFTLKMLRMKKLQNVIDNIIETFDGCPVYVVFDMSVCDPTCAPCVYRYPCEKVYGLNLDEIVGITKGISKMNIVGIDITGYDLRLDDKNLGFRVTCETVQTIIKNVFNIVEKRINIFNENTRFLIWRSVTDEDVGWHILRDVPLDVREDMLNRLSHDDIILFEVPTDDDGVEYENVYISSTTIAEQESKSYAICDDGDYTSCTLYPEEKVSMLFELLNVKPI
jgi:arginase family enzyme